MSIYDFGTTAFLGNAKAIVSVEKDTGFLDDTKDMVIPVPRTKDSNHTIKFVYWGKDNSLPVKILNKIHANVTVASNIDFNARISYGDGIMVVKKVRKEGKIQYEELLESDKPDIFDFLRNNNMYRILQEAGNDMVTFGDSFVEFIVDRNQPPKIVMVRHKEAVFSRLSEQNERTGKIDWHGYSAKWQDAFPDDIVITPFLDRDAPLYDLKKRLGQLPDEKTGKKTVTKDKRFIMSLSLPVPGRFYYNKPYWWSIFKSGWYDFACSIPKFKQALIENEMVLKYEIKINEAFWDKLYSNENITDEKEKIKRKFLFLQDLNNFLAGKEIAGKSFVSHFKYDNIKGYEVHDIIIKPIESFLKGGEYIEDVEEASNVISYAMGVHPSLQGATPGKGKSINGTEARELFIIKQAMTKPIRDALLSILYTVKEINGWDKDIHFAIPNIMLTTLDKNTGQIKSIGNQEI